VENPSEYRFNHSGPTWASQYLWGPVLRTIARELPNGGRVFEVGCGNGAAAHMLAAKGYQVTAVDPSESGIRLALSTPSTARLAIGSAYDELSNQYGTFPVVLSLEVVEHCFYPRKFAATVFNLVESGGVAIISTPYHGYLKNLALAILNRFDAHWGPLWDGGHIKFWSLRTLRMLLEEAGFVEIEFIRAGRIAPLAKSMIAIARRPKAGPH
jgi:2-polyprenyl-6-hydroxyphenyl methylase/3-demethylubiquinone-9 3-methyltransferase